MSKTPAGSIDELLNLAGCAGNETAACMLSTLINGYGSGPFESPGKKLGPVWKDDYDRRLKQIAYHADMLANLLSEVSKKYPYNFAIDVVEGENCEDAELVARLKALAIAAKEQKPEKNAQPLDIVCELALEFLREHSEIKIRKGATGDSFRFVHKFAECIFARELASDGPGGTKGAYRRAVKCSDISGQNLAPTPS